MKQNLTDTIPHNYTNNQINRAFFKSIIGNNFKFNTPFMQWMNANKGIKTYQDAIDTYNKIKLKKKDGKKYTIGKQFKYNQYTRDFFENNSTLSRPDCIKCWHYKKSLGGEAIYDKDDLVVLEK